MNTLLTVLLLITIIIAAASFIQALFNKENPLTTPKTRKLLLITAGTLLLLNSCLYYATPGHQYYCVAPTGQKYAWFNSGYKLKAPFTRIQEWEKVIDIKCIPTDSSGEHLEPTEGIEGVISNGVPVRFIDQVTGDLMISMRVQLPSDAGTFIALAEEFRHPKNLVNNTLIPTIREQVINVSYMYTAENYVSGAASDYRQTLDDALKNGGFKVRKQEFKDTVWADIQVAGADTNMTQRQIIEIRTVAKVEKVLDDNNTPIRIDHDITRNKITINQVIVDNLVLDESFRRKLEEQRDLSAQKSIEYQRIETERAKAQGVIATGERQKAEERVAEERAQVAKLISIETSVKEEESKRQLAEIALQTTKLKAEAQKVAADAEAYQNSKLVSAGLTPQERAEWEYKTRVETAAKLAGPDGIVFPTYYMTGGASGNSNDIMNMLLMKMLESK